MTKLFLSFSALLCLVTVNACSSEDTTPAATDTAVTTVQISSNQFSPAQVKIKVGETVRWTWGGGVHNVVSGTSCTDDGKFKSGAPVGGGTFDQKFETAGTFPYFCTPHCSMGMTGEVIVE